MVRMITVFIAAAIVVAAAARAYSARAESRGVVVFASAGGLRTWCQASGAPRAACRGYLMGVVDLLRHPAVRGSLEGATPPCMPDGLKAEQARLIFLAHLHANPEGVDRAAADQVWVALNAAFGCGRRDPVPAAPARDGERMS